MSGKRYRQRRRFMRTWGGHPDARGLWWRHGQPPRLMVPAALLADAQVKLQQGALLDCALYSTPMGYADPLNYPGGYPDVRSAQAAADALLAGHVARGVAPGPVLRGIASS